MIDAICLLGYAAVLLASAPLLARAQWPDRAPRLAITLWLALPISIVAAVMLGGFALLVPTEHISTAMGRLLAACTTALRADYSHPGGRTMTAAGALTAAVVAARIGWCAAANARRAARARRAYRMALRTAGQANPLLNAVVLDYPQPAAWCLPGTVVITSQAVATLDDAQIAAVLAHERRHQKGHHHLLVLIAGSLANAFPPMPAFRLAHQQVARLTELLADDAAAAASHRLAVAEALLALGTGGPGVAGALGAGGTETAPRIRRLIANPAAPLSRAAVGGGIFAVVGLAALPVAMLVTPALAAACPMNEHPAAARVAAERHLVAALPRPDKDLFGVPGPAAK